jgi:superfamily II DNA helicase RecQ
MQVKMYCIPVMGGEMLTDEMNVFLRSKKILQVEKHFLSTVQSGSWTFCISYLEDTSVGGVDRERIKVDYSKILDEAGFKRFSKMKEIRKQLATEDGVPAYAIFTDEELSNIAKMEGLTLSKMKSIKGIGEKKVEKYGQQFLIQNDGEKSS